MKIQKISQKTLAVVIAIVIISSSTAGLAEAKTKGTSTVPFKMKLEVAQKGNVHILGKVASVSNTGFALNSWGGTWNVETSTSTKFSNKGMLSLMKVGDVVQVHGSISPTASTTIIAKQVKDKSFKKDLKNQKKDLKFFFKDHKDDDKPRTGTTTASTTDALKLAVVQGITTSNSSLAVTLQNGQAYTILTSSSTKFYNRALNPINFSDIKTGHALAAYGTLGTTTASTTLTASIIHDLSL